MGEFMKPPRCLARVLGDKRARLEGLEPPTRCLEGSWTSVLTDGK